MRDLNLTVTFAVVGKNVDAYPEILEKMFADGHQIASHTYHHISLTNLTEQEIDVELKAASDSIFRVIGKSPRYIQIPQTGNPNSFVSRGLVFPFVLRTKHVLVT